MSRALFRTFHAANPRGEWELDADWPATWFFVGAALSVVYRSDKWGDGVIDYVHPFDPGTNIYAGAGSGPELELAAPRGELAWLGGVVELEVALAGAAVPLVPRAGARGAPQDLPVLLAYGRGRSKRLIILPERPVPALGLGAGDAIVVSHGPLDVRAEGIVG